VQRYCKFLVLSDLIKQGGYLTSPWLGPAWTSCLKHYPRLEVLIIKSPILFTPIKQWISCLPAVQCIYLCHGYDEDLGISGHLMSGFNNMYFQDVWGRWTCEEWRLCTPRRNLPRALQFTSGKATKKQNCTEFDSEVYYLGNNDSWS